MLGLNAAGQTIPPECDRLVKPRWRPDDNRPLTTGTRTRLGVKGIQEIPDPSVDFIPGGEENGPDMRFA